MVKGGGVPECASTRVVVSVLFLRAASPSTLWVPGVKLRVIRLGGKCLYPLSCLTRA